MVCMYMNVCVYMYVCMYATEKELVYVLYAIAHCFFLTLSGVPLSRGRNQTVGTGNQRGQ